MINFIISILLGVIPDVLYYFLMIKNVKNTNNKNILFFVLLTIIYIISNVLVTYNFYFYLIFDVVIYLVLKLLYKSKINDFFFVIVLDLYLALSSTFAYLIFENYYLAFFIYRLLLIIPLFFTNKIKNLYINYSKVWNRHNDNRKIKSITVRNIVLVILHTMVIAFYLILSYIINII